MSFFLTDPSCHYSDVVIVPQFSEILTRKDVLTSVYDFMGLKKIDVPIMCANMDTICEAEMCIAMWKSGGLGALHRFMTIKENVSQFLEVSEAGCECLVSLGVNAESLERFEALHAAGARRFIVDIAHGHSVLMRDMMFVMRKRHPNIFILAGNVGTPVAVEDLEDWGADAIKVGIAGGAVCSTKNVTGVETPMFSTVKECAAAAKIAIVADGGIRTYADCAKAIGIGASIVMAGFLFAGCDETPPVVAFNKAQIDNKTFESKDSFRKLEKARQNLIYRGMASQGAMQRIGKTDRTPEGSTVSVDLKGPAAAIVAGLKGGLQSSFSYSGARNLPEFQEKVIFRIRG